VLHAGAPALDAHEGPENDRRHDDVQPEERADPVGEELLDDQTKIEAVLTHEWQELRVWQHGPDDAEQQVEALRFHRRSFFFGAASR
jgi:hypothetical protein